MIADLIKNKKETIFLYKNLEKGDKVMCKNSNQIIEIMDNPPCEKNTVEFNSLDGIGYSRLVIFKNWISPFIYPCHLMIYNEKFQSMKIGDVLNAL